MMTPPINAYKEIEITDEGVSVLTDYIVVENHQVSAHFFDTKNNREIFVEQLGNHPADQERMAKICDDHITEVAATLGTINALNKSLSVAIKDGSFAAARKKFTYKKFEGVDEDDKLLLSIEVGVDQRKIFVTYVKTNGFQFVEQIGDLEEDSKNLKEMFEEFQNEFIELCREIKNSGKSISESVDNNSFFGLRTRKQSLKHIEEFTKAIRDYMEMYCSIQRQTEWVRIDESLCKDIKKESNEGITILDWDITAFEVMMAILSRSEYNRDPVPAIPVILKKYIQLRKLRTQNITRIKHLAVIKEYQLYHDQTLVAMKVDGLFHVFESELYQSALQIPTESDMNTLMQMPITDKLIDWAVDTKLIPENRRRNFKKWIGQSLAMAVINSNAYGNIHSIQNLQNNELSSWNKQNLKLFAQIVSHLQKRGMVIHQARKPAQLKEEQFDNPLVLNIYKYMQGELSLENLGITPENALEILEIVKLYDYAITLLNLASRDKHQYQRSSYELKARILEMAPSKKSYEIFTKTLQTKDLAFCLKHMDPTRAGLHAKEIGTIFIRARQLSYQLDRILGVRGNTASGKSTLVPYGALNVDDLKAGLKKGYKILNSQVHSEAAKVFETLLEEIIKRLPMNYCLDARLIEPDYVESSILLPAQQRNILAEVKDYEVPLDTSLLRVLTRPTYGKDPCPSLEAIVDGYIRLRRERATVIDLIKKDKNVIHYELLFKQGSTHILVAQKKEGEFKILNEKLFNECLNLPSKDEINFLVNQIITPKLILTAIDDHVIYPHQFLSLLPFLGKSLGDSVTRHAEGKI